MTEAEDDGVTQISVDKEGSVLFYSKKKWKTKWAILSGGVIFSKGQKKRIQKLVILFISKTLILKLMTITKKKIWYRNRQWGDFSSGFRERRREKRLAHCNFRELR
jgi:hypothetical protein